MARLVGTDVSPCPLYLISATLCAIKMLIDPLFRKEGRLSQAPLLPTLEVEKKAETTLRHRERNGNILGQVWLVASSV